MEYNLNYCLKIYIPIVYFQVSAVHVLNVINETK